MIITGRQLAEIGELLHGPEWRAWLARKLDRTERTVRYYETNHVRMPRKVRDKLLTVIRAQREALEAWELDLEK